MGTAAIVQLCVAGGVLVLQALSSWVQIRKASPSAATASTPQQTVPAGQPMPTAQPAAPATMPTVQAASPVASHPLLADLQQVGSMILSQQGASGLQSIITALTSSIVPTAGGTATAGAAANTLTIPALQELLQVLANGGTPAAKAA